MSRKIVPAEATEGAPATLGPRKRGRPRRERTPEELREATRLRVAEFRRRRREARQAEAPPESAVPGKAVPGLEVSARDVSPEDVALIDRYLDARRNRLLSATRSAYRSDLLDLAAFAGCGLLGAGNAVIAEWLYSNTRDPKRERRDRRRWSRRTARRKLAAVRGFYRWAVREDLVVKDPALEIELARGSTEVPLRIAPADWRAMIDHVETQIALREDRTREIWILDALILHLLYHLALRVSEAHSLRLSSVFYEDGELRVRIVKKGDKVRAYPLVGPVLTAYRRWMAARAEVKIVSETEGPGGDAEAMDHADFICVHPWTGRRTRRQRAWKRLRRIAAEAGLAPELVRCMSPHKLRHGRAYHRLEDGASLAEVQALLDHESVQTTNVYVRADERGRLAALRASSLASAAN